MHVCGNLSFLFIAAILSFSTRNANSETNGELLDQFIIGSDDLVGNVKADTHECGYCPVTQPPNPVPVAPDLPGTPPGEMPAMPETYLPLTNFAAAEPTSCGDHPVAAPYSIEDKDKYDRDEKKLKAADYPDGAALLAAYCAGALPGTGALASTKVPQFQFVKGLDRNFHADVEKACVDKDPNQDSYLITLIYLAGPPEDLNVATLKTPGIMTYLAPISSTSDEWKKLWEYFVSVHGSTPEGLEIATIRLQSLGLRLQHTKWHEEQHAKHWTEGLSALEAIVNAAPEYVPNPVKVSEGGDPKAKIAECLKKITSEGMVQIKAAFSKCYKTFHDEELPANGMLTYRRRVERCACNNVNCEDDIPTFPTASDCDYAEAIQKALNSCTSP